MKLFFCGIGGIGMSALARWCMSEGYNVTGSEPLESNITKKLKHEGAKIFIEQKSSHIDSSYEGFIYTEAIPRNHPERIKAQELNIPQYSYFEYLGKMTTEKRLIGVAGTHGKTTTTGIIASGMISAGLDPWVVIGAQTQLLGGANFRPGKSEWAVVEACEYRENFRFLSPEIVILTNIEVDHVDYFKSEEQYFEAYRNFIKNAETVICHPNDPNTEKVLEGFMGEVIYTKNVPLPLTLIGRHNQLNAQLAVALGTYLNTDKSLFNSGVSEFTGTARRQELIGEKNEVLIYDDYGHHPTEIKATYEAFSNAFPHKKIGLIFEPHQYSRTRELYDEFVAILSNIEILGILPIYEARDSEEDIKALTTESFSHNCGGELLENNKDIEVFVEKYLSTHDIVIFMGAGKVSQIAHTYLES